jgi:hypothetical protein
MLKTQGKKFVAETLDSEQLQTERFTTLRSNKNKLIMKDNLNNTNNKITNAKILLVKDNKKKVIYLKGRKAQTILSLKKVKKNGLPTIDAINSELPRISDYIFHLRHDYGLNILTIREGENRKGRYVLLDNVEILESSKNRRKHA